MKKRLLAWVLSFALALSLLPVGVLAAEPHPFQDVPSDHWANEAVQYAYDEGLMDGVGPTTFAPGGTLTRAMFVTILGRQDGVAEDSQGENPFTDVADGQWYTPYVTWAAQEDIVGGYGDNRFGPTDPITREQMAAILYRYAQYKGYDTSETGSLDTFPDAGEVSEYALEPMAWTVGTGLIAGMEDNTLRPQGTATRAQAATLLMRFCETVVGEPQPEPTTYTVTFDYNYGNKGTYTTAAVEEGQTVQAPANPTRSGYTFAGWYTQATGGEQFDFGSAVTGDVTVYAHWNKVNGGGGTVQPPVETETFTVTFDSNGGSAVEAQRVTSTELVSRPADPEREGYIFIGWHDPDGNTFFFDDPVESDLTLTAQWVEITPLTEEELAKLNEYSGENFTALEDNSADPLTQVEVEYTLDGVGGVSVRQVTSGPMLLTAGLLGTPVEIDASGANVKSATIIFHYDPAQLNSVAPSDLAIVWYDEENDVVKLLENGVVDTTNHTVSVQTTHFSRYAVVDQNQWNEAWGTVLPVIRTEETPYYNIVLAMDKSGSMSGQKIQNSIQAAQNFVDILADNDCVSVLAFASSTQVLADRLLLGETSGDISNKSVIKNALSSIGSNGGTNINDVLLKASEYVSTDTQYQSIVVLVSDGQSDVNNQTIQKLKDNGQKVIAVGIGSDVDQSLMQRIADATGGSYLFCEEADDLADAFIDLQNIYIGSTKDTDGDGLPDLVETAGMRDQYGEIWTTDPNKADSDGDGYSDGEEMGNYNAQAEHPYFNRVSHPDLETIKSEEAYLIMPGEMMYSLGSAGENTLTLMVNVIDAHYRMEPDLISTVPQEGVTPPQEEATPKEYIYSAPENLKVELTRLPTGFTLESIETTSTVHGYLTTYQTTAVLSYPETTTTFDTVTWRVTADNCSEWSGYSSNGVKANYIEKEQSTEPTITAGDWVDSARVEFAEKAFYVINTLCKYAEGEDAARENEVETSLSSIKSEIHFEYHSGDYDLTKDKEEMANVYQAIAQAILQKSGMSLTEEYSTDPVELVNQISNDVKGLVGEEFNESVQVNKKTYTINGPIWGDTISFITVTWNGNTAHFNWNDVEGSAKNIADYCAKLAELNNTVWREFMAKYVAGVFGLTDAEVNTHNIAQKASQIMSITEDAIEALSDSDGAEEAANELIEKFSSEVKQVLQSDWGWDLLPGVDKSNEKLRDLIKQIPGGEDIIDDTIILQQAKESFDNIASLQSSEGTTEGQMKAAYGEFIAILNAVQPL